MRGKLNRDARMFVQLQILFNGMIAVLTLFVNTFLMNVFGTFSKEVLLYNGVSTIVQPLAMLMAIRLNGKKGALFTQRLGFVCYSLALIVLCVFGQRVSRFYPVFSMMLSIGAGYYYSVYSSQMLCYTTDDNRDRIAGMVGLWGAVISVFLPLLSGILIKWFGTGIGYSCVFGIAALLAALSWMTSLYLPKIPGQQGATTLASVGRQIFRDPRGRLIMLANGLCNGRSFTIPIFVTLLFFNLVPDEFLIGLNSTIGSIVTLLGAAIYANAIKSENRVKASVVAAFAVILVSLGMILKLNVFMLITFHSVYVLFNTFMSTPVLNMHFKVMEELGLSGECGCEVHFFRELFVSAGRILGLLLVWFAPKTNGGAVFVLICMTATAVVNAAILRRLDRKESI